MDQAVSAVSEHQARVSQVNKYADFSRLALMFYDMLLNLGREKRLTWDSKFRASSVVYLCVRYPVVAFQVFQVCWTTSTPHCNTIERAAWGIALVPTRITICASFILRVNAVTERNTILVGVLTLIGLLIIGLDLWQDVNASCTQGQNTLSSVLTFISLIVFDITTSIISWRLVRVIHSSSGLHKLSGKSMIWLVMRSGVLYFMVMTGIQLGAVILYFLPQGVYSAVLNDYTILLSSILTARFLLDLRDMAEPESDQSVATEDLNLHPIRFCGRSRDLARVGLSSRVLGTELGWSGILKIISCRRFGSTDRRKLGGRGRVWRGRWMISHGRQGGGCRRTTRLQLIAATR
ncbi:hypothetical protein OE88DRAFT_1667198 [Heliocybe sulcata]|uniref:DUF6533 domain-containing protein n=1 Tax=Heliocybe sulcata TaxID=5364 RepID=A0A5C3MNM6_9AGAM|nr:hypothetical protein OE88DRAFT_1667198 [Heliocybe sulcata]